MISPAKRREAQFSLKARKEPGDRPTREGRKGSGKAATLEGARHYRWEAVAEITWALFFAHIPPAHDHLPHDPGLCLSPSVVVAATLPPYRSADEPAARPSYIVPPVSRLPRGRRFASTP